METENENSLSIELFWSYFNDILRKESGLKNYVFNPRGWITDMAGCNIEGLKKVFGPDVVQRVKTCEFHFKQCRNRQARKFDEETRKKFKKLSEALLEAQNPTSYEKAKENLDNFIAEEPEWMRLTTWLGWWNKRRSFIFPAFQCTKVGPTMNLAEVVHASSVKRDKMNIRSSHSARHTKSVRMFKFLITVRAKHRHFLVKLPLPFSRHLLSYFEIYFCVSTTISVF